MSDPQLSKRAGCLNDETISALVAGALRAAEAEDVRVHLDGCLACHALAAEVARQAFTLGLDGNALEGATVGPPGTGEAELAGLLARARARVAPGSRLGRYVVARALGEGGMGIVYLAHDPELERDVALKVVAHAATDPDALPRRLLREARAAAKLQHANVVTIFDVGQIERATYVAMELVAGSSMRPYVGDASVPMRTRAAWLLDVARALAAAHEEGLVHRDVKPENVMVRTDGVIKVVDFGIARRLDTRDPVPAGAAVASTLTTPGAVIGTPMYMAPEQLRGDEVDPRCDQFAWGVLAFELVTGARPWEGRGVPLVSQILSVELPPMRPLGDAAIPAGFEMAIRRAVSKSPADRFSSMKELIAAIEECATAALVPNVALPLAPLPAPPALSSRVVVLAVGTLVVAAFALAIAVLARAQTPRGSVPASTASTALAHERAADVPVPSTTDPAASGPAASSASSASSAPARPDAPHAARPEPASTRGRAGAAGSSASSDPSASRSTSPGASQRAACDPPFTWRGGVKIPKAECPLD